MLKSSILRRSAFLVFGYVVGLLAFIIGMSYLTGMKQKNFLETVPTDNQVALGIINSNLGDLSNFIETNSEYGMTIIKKEKDIEVVGTFLGSDDLFKVDVKGRFINQDDINNNEPVAVVGKAAQKLCYYKENHKYIQVMGEEFKVVGEIKGSAKTYKQIYVPGGILIDKYKDVSTGDFQFVIMKKSIEFQDFDDSVREALGEDALFYDVNETYKVSENSLFTISIIILLICSINVINFSYFWIHSRVREIALRKAVGATNGDIFSLIFNEMISLTFISLFIAYIIQFVIVGVVNRTTLGGIYLLNSASNFLYSSVLSIVLSFITTIPTYLVAIKFEPAMILKGE